MENFAVRRLCRPIMRAALFLSSLFFALPIAPQQENLTHRRLAERISQIVLRAARPFKTPSVVVVDFSQFDGRVTQLGAKLADEVSQALSKQAPEFTVIPRTDFGKTLEKKGFVVADLNEDQVALYVCNEAGAQFAVLGLLRAAGDSVELRIRVVAIAKGKKIGEARERVPMDTERRVLLGKPVPVPVSLEGPETQLPRARSPGYTEPHCVSCPLPQMTDAARIAKTGGRVVLRIAVETDGTARVLKVLRGRPYGLTESAVEAVAQWRFKPALGPDHKPAAVVVDVEVDFRLL